jgi:hypothetical protein
VRSRLGAGALPGRTVVAARSCRRLSERVPHAGEGRPCWSDDEPARGLARINPRGAVASTLAADSVTARYPGPGSRRDAAGQGILGSRRRVGRPARRRPGGFGHHTDPTVDAFPVLPRAVSAAGSYAMVHRRLPTTASPGPGCAPPTCPVTSRESLKQRGGTLRGSSTQGTGGSAGRSGRLAPAARVAPESQPDSHRNHVNPAPQETTDDRHGLHSRRGRLPEQG